MVSKPVTSRSISRSASLISALVAAGCGSSTGPVARPSQPARQHADLVVVAGDIRTMDPDHPRATALAITGGRIVYVGDQAGLPAGWTAGAAISVPTGTGTPGPRRFPARSPAAEGTGKLGTELGMRPKTIAVNVHRLRQRLRSLVRQELLQTVADPESLEEELRELRTSFDIGTGGN